jgi:hypothetical protein
MAKLSKVDAAKAAGVSRQTLYTYIKDGRISVDGDGLVDTAELLRAGFALHDLRRPAPLQTGHDWTSKPETVDVNRELIDMLKQQLAEAQAREQAALERERESRQREALLLHMLQEAQQRYDRLLEAPRPAPAEASRARPHRDRRATWERILAYLRDHPGPQRALDVEQALGLETPARYAMGRMVQAGLLRRVQDGVYEVVETAGIAADERARAPHS